MSYEFKLSNAKSGANLYIGASAYTEMLKVSQRWTFHAYKLERVVVLRPDPRGSLLTTIHADKTSLPYRINGGESLPSFPLFGVVPYSFDTMPWRANNQLHFSVPEDSLLPAPRVIRASTTGYRDPGIPTGIVMLQLLGNDYEFRVPQNELHEITMRWSAKGYLHQQEEPQP